jgi:hypothetical protein
MFAGQGVTLAREMPAADLVESLVAVARRQLSAITQTIRASEQARANDCMNERRRIKTRLAAQAQATGSEAISSSARNERRKI